MTSNNIKNHSNETYMTTGALPSGIVVEELPNGDSLDVVVQSPTPEDVQRLISDRKLDREYNDLKREIAQRAWSMTRFRGCNRMLLCMMVNVDDDSVERWDYASLAKIVIEYRPQFESKGVLITLGCQRPVKIGPTRLRDAAVQYWIQFINMDEHDTLSTRIDTKRHSSRGIMPSIASGTQQDISSFSSSSSPPQHKVVILDDFSLLR